MRRFFFDSSRQVSSGLALLIVLALSMTVGWMAIASSRNVISNFQVSPMVKMEKRGMPAADVKTKN